MSRTDELLQTDARRWRDDVDTRRPDLTELLLARPVDGVGKRPRRTALVVATAASVALVAIGVVVTTNGRPDASSQSAPSRGTDSIPGPFVRGRTIRIPADGSCPNTLGAGNHVAPPSVDTGGHLLPPGGRPASFLVCEYDGAPPRGEQTRISTRLTRQVRLARQDAGIMAAAIARISPKPPPAGPISCPNQGFGTITILAVRSGERTVDLFWNTSGCESMDNGRIRTFEIGNPSFYKDFADTYDRVVGR